MSGIVSSKPHLERNCHDPEQMRDRLVFAFCDADFDFLGFSADSVEAGLLIPSGMSFENCLLLPVIRESLVESP